VSADAGAVPAPGSDAARKAGCTCSIPFVSCGGTYSFTYRIDAVTYYYIGDRKVYFVAVNCPVHDPLPDMTMRPRTGAGGAADADAE